VTEKVERRNWSREELILAFKLYCELPFGKIHNRNPEIIELSKYINRSASSVSWKLVNFASLDPSLKTRGISGASHSSKADKAIWNEFHSNWEKLIIESEQLHERYRAHTGGAEGSQYDIKNTYIGEEKVVSSKSRIEQNFFRNTVLSNYNATCAISNINEMSLLIASHIIPWSKDENNRLNPHNGLCLSVLYDKAFDKGLITFNENLELIVANKLKKQQGEWVKYYFLSFEKKIINLPNKFHPDENFLKYHRNEIFLNE